MKISASGKKANGVRDLARLEQIPSVGPSIATDLRQLGISVPSELPGRGPYAMYEDQCQLTGQRHDPYLLDTFIAAVRFMEGAPKKPWWKYSAERKREMAARKADTQEYNDGIRGKKIAGPPSKGDGQDGRP